MESIETQLEIACHAKLSAAMTKTVEALSVEPATVVGGQVENALQLKNERTRSLISYKRVSKVT